MRRFQSAAHYGQRSWRRTKRVFVRGELDDLPGVHAEFARGFLDRFCPARSDRGPRSCGLAISQMDGMRGNLRWIFEDEQIAMKGN